LSPDRYRLRPRMLRDVSQLGMRVKLFGDWVEFPVCVAPTARHDYAHPDGEIATARGKSERKCEEKLSIGFMHWLMFTLRQGFKLLTTVVSMKFFILKAVVMHYPVADCIDTDVSLQELKSPAVLLSS